MSKLSKIFTWTKRFAMQAGRIDTFNHGYLAMLRKYQGLLTTHLKVPIPDQQALTLVYTPGVGQSCLAIQKDPTLANRYTNKGNSIVLLTDGSGYSKFGNPKWNLDMVFPQLEANSLLYKLYGNVDCYPIILDSTKMKTPQDYIDILTALSGSFQGIELFNMDSKLTTQIKENLKSKPMPFYLITAEDKKQLEDVFTTSNMPLDKVYSPSILHRALLDCQMTGQISQSIFSCLYENLKAVDLQNTDEQAISQYIHQQIVENLHKEKKAETHMSVEETLHRYEASFQEGGKAFLDEWPKDYNFASNTDNDNSLALHAKNKGVIQTASKIQFHNSSLKDIVNDQLMDILENLIMENPETARELTFKQNWGGIITNGTAILGLGDIGATAGLPVMEGKSCIFKQLGGADIAPICFQEKDVNRLVQLIEMIAPSFQAINLEDIKSPQCFTVEAALKQSLKIPIFHDDQHGTAIITSAALINSMKLMKKEPKDAKIIINGGGAAGLSITEMLLALGFQDIIVCDTKGAIYEGRPENMNPEKDRLAQLTNRKKIAGTLEQVVAGTDIFIGVSAAGALKKEWAQTMAKDSCILAMANPVPEIMPEDAKAAGALIVGTGRSDFKNQVNNSLVFPGIFRAILDVQAKDITMGMKLAAAHAVANVIKPEQLNPDFVVPPALSLQVGVAVAYAVANEAIKTGIAQAKDVTAEMVAQRLKIYNLEGEIHALR